jgi:hypothetical protein
MDTIEIGSIVKLNSGSPDMVVEKIVDSDNESHKIAHLVYWSPDVKCYHRAHLPLPCLKLITAP